MTTSSLLLEATNIHFGYGRRAVLRGANLGIAAGQILGLVGANGAGKSTLISILSGLRRADSGTVRIAQLDPVAIRRSVAGSIGLAPQELGLYPTLTVKDNLYSFGSLSARRSRARAEELAILLGLTAHIGHRADALSGGEKRRLHTGLALLHSPTLLFVDEPTVGADVASRADILSIIQNLAAAGTAVLYTTHYLSELEQLEADIAVLQSGVVTVTGSWREIIDRWATASVRLQFSVPAPMLAGWVQDGFALRPINPLDDPASACAAALIALGDAASSLTAIEIMPANLEAAFLAISACANTEQLGTAEGLSHDHAA